KTPCESTPRRFAQMSDFAHSCAMAGATPAATNSARAKRSSSALEITCDPVFDGIGTLQQFSRRARVAPDLYTKALAEQQSRIALRRAWAMRAMVGLCRPAANGTMRASAQTRGVRSDFPSSAKVMIDETHSVARRSWVASANGHADFPIQNLPLGVFTP